VVNDAAIVPVVKITHSVSEIQRALGIGRLFDTLRDAVVVADANAERIVLWNPAATRIFGYSAEEAVEMPLERLVPERLRAKHRGGIARYRSTLSGDIIDSQRAVELPALRKDGTELHIELMLSPIHDADVPGVFVLAVIRDVTERKQMEVTKDNFIANAAHELRTPVTAVLGSADLIARWRDLPDQLLDECIATLTRQTQRLSTLVRNMLDLSRLQRKRSDIRVQAVTLGDVAARVFEGTPPPAGKTLDVSIEEDAHVLADPERLDQVLTNLLINAFAYGGPDVRVVSSSSDDSVVVAVSDNGNGVPDELLSQLFEPFSRGENSMGIQGSGLGLTIVRMLVEAMGGQVWYDGAEGACFRVQLARPPAPISD
jgi:PAS domain S-box-containing protein